jgi:hypothetical protein
MSEYVGGLSGIEGCDCEAVAQDAASSATAVAVPIDLRGITSLLQRAVDRGAGSVREESRPCGAGLTTRVEP